MRTTTLTSELYANMIAGGAAKLSHNRAVVNELNVFPVPDGDTGDNMYMTIDSGYSALSEGIDEALGATSYRVARGMLLGARGNSGVILSRIFAGISKGLHDVRSADIRTFARALENGISESYRAVQTPVEGTILTVYSDAVRYANGRITDRTDFESYFDDFLSELRASLARTPTLLDVLRESGVVDSGGAGIVFIAEGMQDALRGVTYVSDHEPTRSVHAPDLSLFSENTELRFGYCTEFLLRLTTAKVGNVSEFNESPLLDWLNRNGDSVVAFREGSIIKAHVHTMSPETVLAYFHAYGEFLTLKIENMMLQHNETAFCEPELKKATPRKKLGIVAVASGAGIRDTFLSIGADAVVDGGQSMNPSAEDLLRAFSSVNADTIFVYPNNSNIMLTAQQAAALYKESEVRVLPSRSIGECYAALSLLDISSDNMDQIEAGSIEVMQSVMSGTVAKASRTMMKDGVSVQEGDYIGFSETTIYSDAETAKEAALGLASALDAGEFGILLLVRGINADPEEAESIRGELEKQYPLTEVLLLEGGQPIYDYLMILE